MSRLTTELTPHPVRALLPPLDVMAARGLSRDSCLRGTGLVQANLEDPQARMTVQQELQFYRNLLDLTGDPQIGLVLGRPFTPQRYGLFGYALMSSETFRHALLVVQKFARLTFSFFDFEYGIEGHRAYFAAVNEPQLEPALLNLFYDREMSAAQVAFTEILGCDMPLLGACLPHDGLGRLGRYSEFFGCATQFNGAGARLEFDAAFLDRRLPQGDPDSSRRLQQQCQMLVGRLEPKGAFVHEVRLLILARPGYFPDIDYVAEKLGVSVSTLRRRLKAEGHGYRELVDEARFGMAREYLERTVLTLEEIAGLLGYSDPSNFTHAFRRWSGEAPSRWRERRTGLLEEHLVAVD